MCPFPCALTGSQNVDGGRRCAMAGRHQVRGSGADSPSVTLLILGMSGAAVVLGWDGVGSWVVEAPAAIGEGARTRATLDSSGRASLRAPLGVS